VIAREYRAARVPVTVLSGQARGGKSAAMNRGAEVARNDVLVFSDATEIYETSALKFLLDEFDDASVAVVSGMHRIRPLESDDGASLTGHSEGSYWRYERAIRQAESDLGATVATVGAILAIRREDWRPLPAGTINDDAWITMTSLARGRNTRFARKAVSWEEANTSVAQEAIRRRRIFAGRLLLLSQKGIWPWRRPWVLIAFLSHKVPLLLGVGVVCNGIVVLMAPHWAIFSVFLAAHGFVFALAFAGYVAERIDRKWRLAHLAYHVMHANLAGLKAYADLLRRRSFLMWDKPTR
jgi:cellulose synthase/poly-beta-1,6-N-acetylglucosamine synthase-like glycosyltransferase